VGEADSFFAIGRHLEAKGIPVPHIYDFDRSAGVIAMEDLGDRHFQKIVLEEDRSTVVSLYKPLLDILVTLGTEGAREFDTRWTYQTPCYDRQVILERECDYFFQFCLAPLPKLTVRRENLQEDFALLSDRGLSSDCTGLIHRDFQSRNVLVYHDRYYVIDFQGARLGPLAYDLASLLIDPYVRLDYEIEEELLSYYWKRLSAQININFDSFYYTYRYCAINRNLQALGAFGFLSKVKGKNQFEAYILPAIDRLRYNLARIEPNACRTLKETVNRLQQNPEILAHTFQHLTK
jgi:aminoglycoside/choline kinase family phosphotransferase